MSLSRTGVITGRPRKPRAQPKGTLWSETRARVFELYGDTCHICLHPGAGDIDHLIPTDDIREYYSLDNLRPAHGAFSRCPECGRCCNQSKGARIATVKPAPSAARPKLSREW